LVYSKKAISTFLRVFQALRKMSSAEMPQRAVVVLTIAPPQPNGTPTGRRDGQSRQNW